MKRLAFSSRVTLVVLILSLLIAAPSLLADGGANHRVSSNFYGVSGGNVNDRSKSFCCSGTLGSLVQDTSNVKYILSNAHVLARSGEAALGEDISQPGMIDLGCGVNEIVADLSAFPALGTNVDGAIAQLRTGAMSANGEILDIGSISSTVGIPSVGLAVAKSGRTTGYTQATIGSINTSVNVQYQRGCGSGKKFTVSYTNQLVINSSSFSAGGDSGSLIVSGHTGASCRQPVGLLYAGSSTTTIANPIAEVLTKVGASLGKTISFVGVNCSAAASEDPVASSVGNRAGNLSDAAVEFATQAMKGRLDELMSRRSFIGVGVGASDTNASEAVIVVYVDQTTGRNPKLPKQINGVRVKRVFTDPFVAY